MARSVSLVSTLDDGKLPVIQEMGCVGFHTQRLCNEGLEEISLQQQSGPNTIERKK
jgi:hypothetical protein